MGELRICDRDNFDQYRQLLIEWRSRVLRHVLGFPIPNAVTRQLLYVHYDLHDILAAVRHIFAPLDSLERLRPRPEEIESFFNSHIPAVERLMAQTLIELIDSARVALARRNISAVTFSNAQEPSNWDIANTTVATDLGDESNTVAVRLQRILDSNSPLMERARLRAISDTFDNIALRSEALNARIDLALMNNRDNACERAHGSTQEALARSKSLLERHLSPPQLEEFRSSEAFTVQVRGRGGFQIMKGMVFNVRELATGETWCAGPQGVPVYDFMLAQKMTLETCPEEFFAVANRTMGRGRLIDLTDAEYAAHITNMRYRAMMDAVATYSVSPPPMDGR